MTTARSFRDALGNELPARTAHQGSDQDTNEDPSLRRLRPRLEPPSRLPTVQSVQRCHRKSRRSFSGCRRRPGNFSPRLVGAASVRFADRKLGIEQTCEVLFSAEVPDGGLRRGLDRASGCESERITEVACGRRGVRGRSPAGGAAREIATWEKDLVQSVIATQRFKFSGVRA